MLKKCCDRAVGGCEKVLILPGITMSPGEAFQSKKQQNLGISQNRGGGGHHHFGLIPKFRCFFDWKASPDLYMQYLLYLLSF